MYSNIHVPCMYNMMILSPTLFLDYFVPNTMKHIIKSRIGDSEVLRTQRSWGQREENLKPETKERGGEARSGGGGEGRREGK